MSVLISYIYVLLICQQESSDQVDTTKEERTEMRGEVPDISQRNINELLD